MGNQIFVFVDESGNHTRPDCYIVAGLWCISEYTDNSKILEPTRDRVSSSFSSISGGELKGSDLGATTINSVISYFPKVLEKDTSIRQGPVPWGTGVPVGFTLYDSDSEISNRLAESIFAEGRAMDTPQLVGLSSIISPLLSLPERPALDVDSVQVILDAKTWERPSHRLRKILRGIDRSPESRFLTKDSRNIPGIQLADVAANARRRRLYSGTCIAGSNGIDGLRL